MEVCCSSLILLNELKSQAEQRSKNFFQKLEGRLRVALRTWKSSERPCVTWSTECAGQVKDRD